MPLPLCIRLATRGTQHSVILRAPYITVGRLALIARVVVAFRNTRPFEANPAISQMTVPSHPYIHSVATGGTNKCTGGREGFTREIAVKVSQTAGPPRRRVKFFVVTEKLSDAR